jgi:conjugal transfer/entry exclusion protein
MTRRLLMGCLLLLFLGLPQQARAQSLVLDVANLAQNVIQAVQTVLIVANQVLELTGLDEIVLTDGYEADLEALTDIITTARGLSYDLGALQGQIQTLYALESAPTNTRELALRLTQIRQVVFETRVQSLRTQTLLMTTLSTVRHLMSLVNQISEFLGNMQGNQTMAQFEGTLSKQLAMLEAQTTTFQRAETVDKLTEPLLQKSLENITEQVNVDYPRSR